MNDKFQNKYRIASARLQHYDYGQNGAYFVTICSKNKQCFFGEIIDGQMQYSAMGNIARDCWIAIPEHFEFVVLGEWVVMPNHVHGVIVIDKNDDDTVETQYIASLQHKNKFGPQSKNLASIIRGFKIGVTKYARQNTNIFNVWQSRFYDHIIRNEKSHQKINEYIINNPLNWQIDKFYTKKDK